MAVTARQQATQLLASLTRRGENVKPTQHAWRLGAIAITGLCAALISGCNTEFGVGPGDGGETPGNPDYPTLDNKRPQSFALASVGSQPANSLESMGQAMTQSADFIAVDLVMSKDGTLVALGSPDITDITNIANHSEFSDRKTTKVIDGISVTGWFASDFTLAELQTLRLKNPTGSSTPTDINSFRIQSLAQVFDWAKRQARTPGLYLQTRNPTYHSKLGLPMEDKLIAALQQAGNTSATSPVMIRSTEVQHLKTLRDKTKVRLVQMIQGSDLTPWGVIQLSAPYDRPYDFTVAGTATTYADMVTTAGLAQIKTYADGISPWKPYVISATYLDKNNDGQPDDLNNDGKWDYRDRQMMSATNLVTNAHAANLFVHPFEFSSDVSTLASDFAGDASKEYKLFYKVGVDAVLSANPADANKAR